MGYADPPDPHGGSCACWPPTCSSWPVRSSSTATSTPTRSTRYWIAAVQAETFAGLGDRDGCERALDAAAAVQGMAGTVHNGGWLRFDGSRLAEERGTCYVTLGRADLAESALTGALAGPLTTRRRAGVLTDLAMIGVHGRDTDQGSRPR